MKFRQFENEKGLTLIEVLATMNIFAILIVLSSTLIIQFTDNAEKTSGSISLQQDTNVLMAEVRNQFYEGKSDICFHEYRKLIDKGESDFVNGDHSLPINNGCIIGVNSQEPLSIHLSTTNSTNQNFTVDTTLTTKNDYVLNLEENPDDFEKRNIEECFFDKNTKFNNYIKTKNGNPGCSKFKFEKSVAFLKGVFFQNHTTVKIGSNLYVKDGLTIQPRTTVTVEKDFHINGDLDVKGALCIKGKFEDKERYSSNIKETYNCFEPKGYNIYILNKK